MSKLTDVGVIKSNVKGASARASSARRPDNKRGNSSRHDRDRYASEHGSRNNDRKASPRGRRSQSQRPSRSARSRYNSYDSYDSYDASDYDDDHYDRRNRGRQSNRNHSSNRRRYDDYDSYDDSDDDRGRRGTSRTGRGTKSRPGSKRQPSKQTVRHVNRKGAPPVQQGDHPHHHKSEKAKNVKGKGAAYNPNEQNSSNVTSSPSDEPDSLSTDIVEILTTKLNDVSVTYPNGRKTDKTKNSNHISSELKTLPINLNSQTRSRPVPGAVPKINIKPTRCSKRRPLIGTLSDMIIRAKGGVQTDKQNIESKAPQGNK